ncbi:MAG: D-alanyl-lipoteichoic acid biosynthesis protein DltD [Coriobacteriales bacterium]|jgi:D-alanine transfer protein|nr:D-alanyl-lipoteichoic acid biosynthesis protein DltD [Coriobacteriales bacterium]
MKLIAAILSAFILAGAGLLVYANSLPAKDAVVPGMSYDVLPQQEKMLSADFLSAALTPESLLVLGSSELTANAFVMAEHPTVFFRQHNIGYSPMLVGSAHTQSLQLALYAGALEPSLESRKVVLIVSPQWFATPDINPQAFRSRFSPEVYHRFLENPALSDELRERVRQRLEELAIDQAVLGAASPQTPIDWINGFCLSAIEDLRLRQQLEGVLQSGYEPSAKTMALEQPDWATYYEQASSTGAAACDNNDFGIDANYYNTYIGSNPAQFIGTDADVSFLNSREYDDLALFLDVCQETGLEVLVAMVPVNGAWYDYTGMPATMRAEYYAKIRALCAEYSAQVADFSAGEYERYFLSDVMHLGWRGWLHLEEAMYDFSRS